MIRKLYKDWKTLAVIFAGTGLLVMSIGTILPTVSAGGGFLDICDSGSGEIQHWDKIIFTSSAAIFKQGEPTIAKNTMADIKVLDDPTTVANLPQKVVDFLAFNSYTRNGGGGFHPSQITVIDVEYAIACVSIFA